MTDRDAARALETIRTLMERGTRYQHLSGRSAIAAGVFALAGSALLAFPPPGVDPARAFLPVWAGVFVLALSTHAAFTVRMARDRGEPVWSRQARTVVLALLPNFLAAIAVTAWLVRTGMAERIPAAWMIHYGCGALATSFFAPRGIGGLGMAFLAVGAAALFLPSSWGILGLAVTFGGFHLAYGTLSLGWERREAAIGRPLMNVRVGAVEE